MTRPLALGHYGRRFMKAADFTLLDQAGRHWTLSANLDTAQIIVFLRGDW